MVYQLEQLPDDILEQLPDKLSGKAIHRLRLLSIAEFLEQQLTIEVPIPDGMNMNQHRAVLGYPLFDAGQHEKELIESSQQNQSATLLNSEISVTASNSAIVGFGNIVGYMFKYATNLVIQRALGAGLFGLYSLALSLVTLVAAIFDLGIDNAMIRYIAIYRGKKETEQLRGLVIFCTAMVGITGILGGLIVLFFAPYLAALVHKPDSASLLVLMAPLVPLLCMQTVWTGGLQGLKEFKRRVLIQRFWVPLVVFMLMFVAFIFFRNIIGVTILAMLGVLISTVINLYFLHRAVSRISASGQEAYEVRTWLGFAIPNFLTTILNTVLDSIDTLLLAFFVTVVAIGQYSAAIKISGFIVLPMTSLNIVFSPTIAELYAKREHQRLEAMFKLVTKWAIILCLPIFLIVTLFSVPLLELSGSSFVAAWPLLVVLALGYMIGSATGSVGYMLLMTGHQRYSFFNSIATVILNVVIGLILTPRYGALGTAISTAFSMSVINLIRLVEVQLLLKMHPYQIDVLKPLVAGLICSLITGTLLYLLHITNFSIRLFHLHLSIQLALIPVFLASYILLLALFQISPEDQIVLDKLSGKLGRAKNKR